MSRVSIVYCPLKNEAIQYRPTRNGMAWRFYPEDLSQIPIDLGYIYSVQEVTAGSRSIDGILGLLKTQVPYTHRHTVCVHTVHTVYVKDQALFKKRPAIGYRVRVRVKPVPDKASLSGYEFKRYVVQHWRRFRDCVLSPLYFCCTKNVDTGRTVELQSLVRFHSHKLEAFLL